MTKVTPLNADEKSGRRRIHLREISGDSETPLETVGQDLRAARLRRGDDLATVSRALKIRKDHLEAVEEDRLENLPGRTYAIGFVRTYAGYLGLDATETVERYKQEISGRHDEHSSPTIAAMPDEPRRLPQGWRFVAGIVVLAVGYGVWHLLSAGSAPQAVPPAPSLAPPKVAAITPPAPPPAVPEQTATPSPAIESSAAASAPPAASATPPQASPAAANTAAAAQPSAIPSPAQAEASPSPTAAGTVFGKNNRNPRVVLKAKGDTHVMVRGQNGVVYINRDLKTGDSYQLPNAVGLTLSTTNAGAVEMDLDGQVMGVAGGDQQSADDVPLDPQTIADRFSH
jgi:cytoskeleton protein RodZ